MKGKILILSLALILIPILTSLGLSQEEKKIKPSESKVKGQLIPHPETNDVKVMTEDYQTTTIFLGEKTRIEATIKAKIEDMAKEAEGRLPKGEVTYTLIEGKPVATKISYSSGETWNMEPPQPREE